jgi:hypothetical protein
MRFNTAPSGSLFVKMYIQKRPLSGEVLSYNLIGSDSKKFTMATALCSKQFDIMPEPEVLQLAVSELARKNNFETVEFLQK